MINHKLYWLIWTGILCSCVYDINEPIRIPKPPVSEETEDLIAEYVTSPPNTPTSAYWNTADYISVDLDDLSTGQVVDETGWLNVHNMIEGLKDFNGGDSSAMHIKAAYDDVYLYILAEWTDSRAHASAGNWLFNGPGDASKPDADTAGWTAQRSYDQFTLEFDLENGDLDVWQWNLALGEPMGYALDGFLSNGDMTPDEGDPAYLRNAKSDDLSEGPMYEWNGDQQELDRSLAGFTLLDPGYYIQNVTEFVGDPLSGLMIYNQECLLCHGPNGDGQGTDWNTGIRLDVEAALNRLSREGMDAFIGASEHSGNSHWTILSQDEKDDVIAYIRGLAGVPGYVLQLPTGSSADVESASTLNLAKISRRSDKEPYKVLFRRALETGNPDDIQFYVNQGFFMNIRLSDNDQINTIGQERRLLTFKPKQP